MNRIPFYKNADRGGRILLLIAAVFLPLCCASTFLFSLVDDGNPRPTATAERIAEVATDLPAGEDLVTAEPQATYTPQATHTPLPTYTPLPTQTPLPTHTALPTAVPPTATPQPTATDEIDEDAAAEALYRAQMVEIVELYTLSLEGLSAQSSAAGANIALMANDEWKAQTIIYLFGLTAAGEQLREMEPPTRFHDAHADMLEAADYYDLVVRYYSEGVDEVDADKLNTAAANLTLGNEAVRRATEKLKLLATP